MVAPLKRSILLTAVLVAVLTMVFGLASGKASSLEIVGRLQSSTFNAVVVLHDHFVVSCGTEVWVIEPKPAGVLEVVAKMDLGATIEDLDPMEDLLLVTDVSGGVSLLDLSNPEHMILLSQFSTSGIAVQAAADNGIAVVTSAVSRSKVGGTAARPNEEQRFMLFVYDLSDPSNPVEIHRQKREGRVFSVEVGDGQALVLKSPEVVEVFDLDNPSEPQYLGKLDLGENWPLFEGDLKIAGGYAYIALGYDDPRWHHQPWGYLKIFSLTSGALPSELPPSQGGYGPFSKVSVAQGMAALPTSTGMVVYDIQDPEHAVVVSDAGYYGGRNLVGLKGDTVLVDAYSPRNGPQLQLLRTRGELFADELGFLKGLPQTTDLVANQETVFASSIDGRVAVVDVSDRMSLVALPDIEVGSQAHQLGLNGNCLWIAAGAQGLKGYDVSDPSAPSIIASTPTNGSARWLALRGNIAFVSADSLSIVDISSATPVTLATYPLSGPAAAIEDGLVLASNGSLSVLDMSSPATPTLAGQCEIAGIAQQIVTIGHKVFVLAEFEGELSVRIVDISDRSGPKELAALDVEGSVEAFATANGRLLVATYTDHHNPRRTVMKSFDVTDLDEPFLTGNWRTGLFSDGHWESQTPHCMTEGGGVLWATMSGGGYLETLQMFDLSDPGHARTPWTIDMDRWGDKAVATISNDQVLVQGEYSVELVDLQQPGSPRVVASIDTPQCWHEVGLLVDGETAYAGTPWDGLQVLDLSRPELLSSTGVLEDGREIRKAALAGNLLLVDTTHYGSGGGSEHSLIIFDTSSDGLPQKIAEHINTSRYLLAAESGYCYLFDWDYEPRRAVMEIIDLSDPSELKVLGTVSFRDFVRDVRIHGRSLLVSTYSGLSIVDISLPSAPVETSFLAIPGASAAVATIDENTILVGSHSRNNLWVVDISNPLELRIKDWIALPEPVKDLVMLTDRLAVAALGYGGSVIVDIGDMSRPKTGANPWSLGE